MEVGLIQTAMPCQACSIRGRWLEAPIARDHASFQCLQAQRETRLYACKFGALVWSKLRVHCLKLLQEAAQFIGHHAPCALRLDSRHFDPDPHIEPFKIRAAGLLAPHRNGAYLEEKIAGVNR